MKKTLLSISAALFSVSMASAQCTPLTAFADSTFGLWPDSTVFINSGAVHGSDYCKQIDLKTFVDTTFGATSIKIDAFKILSVTGLPAGFTWTGGGTTWDGTDTWYNPPATAAGPGNPSALAPVQGCLRLEADVAAVQALTAGDYPLIVTVDIRIGAPSLLQGTWASSLNNTIAVDKYILRVNADSSAIVVPELNNDCSQGVGNSVEALSASRFDVGQSYPNPATGETVINFNTPTASAVEFAVYNMLGVAVISETINAEAGVNEYRFNADKLASGMYVYTMRNNGSAVTKRMIVK